MNLLLTGATGFIGQHLARTLHARGDRVALLVRPSSRLDALPVALSPGHPSQPSQPAQPAQPSQPSLHDLQVHIYDGSEASVAQALAASQPEVVIHVASLFLAQHSSADVARLIASNLTFPTQLLQAMSEQGVRRFINTGTSWQHHENQAASPVNLYAASKQAFEALLDYYVQAQGFQALTLKLFDTYGPGDTRPKLFSLLRRAAHSGEVLRMSPGEQLLDLVYIDDVVQAYLLALAQLPPAGQAASYAVSNPARLSLRELVALYAQTVGRPVHVAWGGLPYRPREVMRPWQNGTPLPGWAPAMPLAEGILRMEGLWPADDLQTKPGGASPARPAGPTPC